VASSPGRKPTLAKMTPLQQSPQAGQSSPMIASSEFFEPFNLPGS
jgi:hypothetical protein